jgi:hypothetical protein
LIKIRPFSSSTESSQNVSTLASVKGVGERPLFRLTVPASSSCCGSLQCLSFLLVILSGPCLRFHLELSHTVYLRMLLACLEGAAIEIGRSAAKVIDLVAGFANLTHVSVSLEKVAEFLLVLLPLVGGLVAGLCVDLAGNAMSASASASATLAAGRRLAVPPNCAQPGCLIETPSFAFFSKIFHAFGCVCFCQLRLNHFFGLSCWTISCSCLSSCKFSFGIFFCLLLSACLTASSASATAESKPDL